MPLEQNLSFDLDTGTLTPQPVRLPVGFDHLLRLNLVKGGSDGYELPGGSSIEMLFDDTFPANATDAVFKIENISWVWNATDSVYEAGFNATQRPLSIIGLTSFASKLTVLDGGSLIEEDFHATFRNSPLPPGIDPCGSIKQEVPSWFQQWLSTSFRFSSLPDQPTLPAAGVTISSIINEIANSSQAEQETLSNILVSTDAAVSAISVATPAQLAQLADLLPSDAVTEIVDLADRTDTEKIYRHPGTKSIYAYNKDLNGGDWVALTRF